MHPLMHRGSPSKAFGSVSSHPHPAGAAPAIKCCRTARRLNCDGASSHLQRLRASPQLLAMQVRNVVQRSSYDLPDAAVSRPQSPSSSGRDQQGRDAILCSRLKGHQAATTCALVTSDAGKRRGLGCRRCRRVVRARQNLGGFSLLVRLVVQWLWCCAPRSLSALRLCP